MERFEIKGKEYELKLNLNSVKYLNGLHDGGGFMLVQKAFTGDIDTFVAIVHAGLFHTEEGFTKEEIEKEIDEKISNEKLDLDEINRISYSTVAESFFYKKTVDKVFASDPRAKKQLESLMK